jgi:hypothetical protein
VILDLVVHNFHLYHKMHRTALVDPRSFPCTLLTCVIDAGHRTHLPFLVFSPLYIHIALSAVVVSLKTWFVLKTS